MNYRNPDLHDHLAARYVLGGLRGGARRRFITLMRDDVALEDAVKTWESRLLPLVFALPPQIPPDSVWQRIALELSGAGSRHEKAHGSFWQGLAWWRTLSAGLAAAVVLLTFLVLRPTVDGVTPHTLAVLADDKASVVLVINRLSDRQLAVQPLQSLAALANGRTLELWAISQGQAPRSLGVIDVNQTSVLRPSLPPLPGDTVAISLEPPGGSPSGAPTGPVVLTGRVS